MSGTVSPGEEDRILQAKKKAMHLLTVQDRTEAALREKLALSGFAPSEVEEALGYVKSYGYIDDRRVAENMIRSAMGSKSRQMIMKTLQDKGVDRETALLAWEEVTAEEGPDEDELIRKAVRKRCPKGIPEDPGELRRLIGYLARRGFSYSDVRRILDVPWED